MRTSQHPRWNNNADVALLFMEKEERNHLLELCEKNKSKRRGLSVFGGKTLMAFIGGVGVCKSDGWHTLKDGKIWSSRSYQGRKEREIILNYFLKFKWRTFGIFEEH